MLVETISITMNGGNGPNSYLKNSKLQEEILDNTKLLLSNSIQENLDVHNNLQHFTIADLGCSVGPNTFSCIQTIMESVQLKFKSQNLESKIPNFQVFFNDHITNDFNTLFKSLPLDRNYMAAGVPGSFYGPLFPEGSMNLMHSSIALHWLSKVPEDVTREESPAWNKGRITYVMSSCEVMNAFSCQFLRDLEAFFSARSTELVSGGLMVILVPCRSEGTLASASIVVSMFECLGDALTDMADEGLISQALVDSFNVPIYIPTAYEVKQVVSSNKHLTIERMEEVKYPHKIGTAEEIRVCSLHIRATVEGILSDHFGSQLTNDLFERYPQKLENFSKLPSFTSDMNSKILFMLVKRQCRFLD